MILTPSTPQVDPLLSGLLHYTNPYTLPRVAGGGAWWDGGVEEGGQAARTKVVLLLSQADPNPKLIPTFLTSCS